MEPRGAMGTQDLITPPKKFYSKVNSDMMFLHKKNSDTMKYATVEINKKYKKIHGKLNYLRKKNLIKYIKKFQLVDIRVELIIII